MPPILSSSKALARLLSGRGCALDLSNGMGPLRWRIAQTRCFRNIARIGRNPCISELVDADRVSGRCIWNSHGNTQTRWFLGCGDGQEGDVLSKVYEEKRVIGYSPEQLFSVVAAVDLYEEFVSWCQRSQIIKRYDDGSFDAELEIGFKFLVESYVSHVQLQRPKYIKTTASDSGLFDHLINVWKFNPGPVTGTCDKFNSPLYREVASMFFKEVVSRLVDSFTDRCHSIYGPSTRVLENSYGKTR